MFYKSNWVDVFNVFCVGYVVFVLGLLVGITELSRPGFGIKT